MRIIALFGRGDIGKTRCLGHLINLIYRETMGCNLLYEGQDRRVSLDYKGKRICVCTWGDNGYEEKLNIDFIQKHNPDIAIVATRTKGETVRLVEKFSTDTNSQLKWVEKYVANFDEKSGQEYLNNLQAKQIFDYVEGIIKGQLYYVDSITAIGHESSLTHVHLIGTDRPSDGFPRTLSFELNVNKLYYKDTEQRIQEDDFVLYRPDSDHEFLLANNEPAAVAMRDDSRNLRMGLTEYLIQGERAFTTNQGVPDIVKSYHVNVGHGNCSLILTVYANGYELWMVDCSTFDSWIRRDYSQNIHHCLNDIASLLKIDLKKLRISRFMLTHTHFDHYNGMLFLLSQGLVDANTIVYANLFYDCASPVWTSILNRLKKLQCKFVEPVSNAQAQIAIHIYHPECRIYQNSSAVSGNVANRIVTHVNDSSVVYGFEFGGHVMVLPGDLEQDGFESMKNARLCSKDLYQSDYYVVSHHGSINGHPDMPCKPITTVLDCAANNLKKVILMGRDGAYSGIYSPVVTSYWQSQKCGLEYTERVKHYMELDWASGSVRYN